jgi:excisionase family DNA binding protein
VTDPKISPAPLPIERLLTVKDVCELLQLKRTYVYDQVHKGELEHVWLGSRLRFEPAQIKRYVEKNRSGAPTAQVLPITGGRR